MRISVGKHALTLDNLFRIYEQCLVYASEGGEALTVTESWPRHVQSIEKPPRENFLPMSLSFNPASSLAAEATIEEPLACRLEPGSLRVLVGNRD
jgi:hypothetical protein